MASKVEPNTEAEITKMEEGVQLSPTSSHKTSEKLTILQKMVAEMIGTYFVVFAGCGAVVVNKIYGSVTFPGIAVTWGLIVMVMIYSLGHISGAHFNPAVTITLAILRKFPWKQVPIYILAELAGSLLASETLNLMFDVTKEAYFGNIPVGSDWQALATEIIITFLLMFVVTAVSIDKRARGEFTGVAVGMTIMLNVFVGGPVSGASMNPARSIGPAIVRNTYKSLWVYIVGPIVGAIVGGLSYSVLKFKTKANP